MENNNANYNPNQHAASRPKKRFHTGSHHSNHGSRPEHNVTFLQDEGAMRRKPNNGKSNNNNSQMARRRFRPEQNTGKIKNVAASRDKYLNLAREAMAQGDRIEAENYLQHADHYYRVLSALQEEDARNRPERTEPVAQEGEQISDATAEHAQDADVAEEVETGAEAEEEPVQLLAAV